ETDAPLVHVGQPIAFTVLAYPDRVFPATISYEAAMLDPTSRRLLVRATIDNSAGLLKPEMFASVKIMTGESVTEIDVPSERLTSAFEQISSSMSATSISVVERHRNALGVSPGHMHHSESSLSFTLWLPSRCLIRIAISSGDRRDEDLSPGE